MRVVGKTFFLFKKRIIMAIIDGGWVVNLFLYYQNTKVLVQNKTKYTTKKEGKVLCVYCMF